MWKVPCLHRSRQFEETRIDGRSRAPERNAQRRLWRLDRVSLTNLGPQNRSESLRKFRIQQLREPRIVNHALEVVVGPGLEPVLRIQFDRLRQAVETVLRLAGNGVKQCQSIEGEIGVGVVCQDAFQL